MQLCNPYSTKRPIRKELMLAHYARRAGAFGARMVPQKFLAVQDEVYLFHCVLETAVSCYE